MGSYLFYEWLYYILFALAWFLVGFIAKQYVSIITNRPIVGITAPPILAVMEDGTVILEGYSSLWERGREYMDWDFPPTPLLENKFFVRI